LATRSRKFRAVVATADVEAVVEEAAPRVAEATLPVESVVERAVRARRRCRGMVEDNDRPEAATGQATELVYCQKVAVADPAERAIGPAEMSAHDLGRIEVRSESHPYPETLAEEDPAAQVIDQVRLVVLVIANGPHLQIDLEPAAVIVPTAATDLGLVIDLERVIGRELAIVLV
jgi:hypothetical protein